MDFTTAPEQDTEENEKKKKENDNDDIRKELEEYLDSALNRLDSNGDKLISFPKNFDKVVNSMTREDLLSQDPLWSRYLFEAKFDQDLHKLDGGRYEKLADEHEEETKVKRGFAEIHMLDMQLKQLAKRELELKRSNSSTENPYLQTKEKTFVTKMTGVVGGDHELGDYALHSHSQPNSPRSRIQQLRANKKGDYSSRPFSSENSTTPGSVSQRSQQNKKMTNKSFPVYKVQLTDADEARIQFLLSENDDDTLESKSSYSVSAEVSNGENKTISTLDGEKSSANPAVKSSSRITSGRSPGMYGLSDDLQIKLASINTALKSFHTYYNGNNSSKQNDYDNIILSGRKGHTLSSSPQLSHQLDIVDESLISIAQDAEKLHMLRQKYLQILQKNMDSVINNNMIDKISKELNFQDKKKFKVSTSYGTATTTKNINSSNIAGENDKSLNSTRNTDTKENNINDKNEDDRIRLQHLLSDIQPQVHELDKYVSTNNNNYQEFSSSIYTNENTINESIDKSNNNDNNTNNSNNETSTMIELINRIRNMKTDDEDDVKDNIKDNKYNQQTVFKFDNNRSNIEYSSSVKTKMLMKMKASLDFSKADVNNSGYNSTRQSSRNSSRKEFNKSLNNMNNNTNKKDEYVVLPDINLCVNSPLKQRMSVSQKSNQLISK